eukprot:TRINITY_DN74743_c0_g1_i1.p1 TRINITY_DN74743_c0_g1~~TRINITY_DN74743_c0_g1_i1.p1  ORF type:complete len:502 (-),score=64.64 TRINITY_DN74743_c0_g1_i1:148-1653(-)
MAGAKTADEKEPEEPAGSASLEWADSRSSRRRFLEAALVNACGFMWFADNGILPAVYQELQDEFAVSLTELGTLTFVRGLVEGLASLPMGFAADLRPRQQLICVGVLLWSAGIVGCGLATDWWMVFLGRMLNGIGLGMVQPLLYSLISDMTPPAKRGSAFGMLRFTGNMGSMAGTYFATLLAGFSIKGMSGWRVVFIFSGLLSALIGILLDCFVKDPRTKFEPVASAAKLVRAKTPELCSILSIPTFAVILAQGVFGTAFFYSFSFFTLWLELSCFDNTQAADIMAAFVFGQALAGIIGGRVFDAVAQRFPNHGPPWTCMLTVAASFPVSATIIFLLQPTWPLYSFVFMFLLFGWVVAWAGFANCKIFGDIVPQNIYSYIFALDRCVEGAIGSIGALATGKITDVFFRFDASSLEEGSCSPSDAMQLGRGVFTVHIVAGGLCVLLNSGLHFTYPRDRLTFKQLHCLESDESEEEDNGQATACGTKDVKDFAPEDVLTENRA